MGPCIVCGRAARLKEHLCPACWRERNPPPTLPPNAELITCAHCGSWLGPNGWKPPAGEGLTVAEAVEVVGRLVPEDSAWRMGRATLTAEDRWNHLLRVTLRSGPETATAAVRIQLKQATCQLCSRKRGNYYESIVQLRCVGRTLDDGEVGRLTAAVAEHLGAAERRDPSAFIARVEEVKGGADIYVGSTKAARSAARAVARSACGTLLETSKLAGRKEGKDMYRTTITIRVPPWRRGDILRFEGDLYAVRGFGDGRVLLTHLATEEGKAVDGDALSGVVALGTLGDIREAVVLSARGGEVLLLDPESLRPVEVPVPPGLAIGGDRVWFIRLDGDIALVRRPAWE